MNRGGPVELRSVIDDLHYAVRSYKKTPAVAAVAVLTIALGVGANTSIFGVLEGVVLRPLPYRDAEHLFRIWPEKRWSTSMFQEVRAETEFAESMATLGSEPFMLLGDEEHEELMVEIVSPDYFNVLEAAAQMGRTLEVGDAVAMQGHVAVLSHGLWVRRFGSDPDIVGRVIKLAGLSVERRTVVGVMPPDFVGLRGGDAWVPMITDPAVPGFILAYRFDVIARLPDPEATRRAETQMRRLVPGFTDRFPSQFREGRRSPVAAVPLLETVVRDVRPRLILLLGTVSIVLLVACSNVAHLLLARGASRRREIALRVALGASQRRIVRQVLTESVFMGLLGGGSGVFLAWVTLPSLVDALGRLLPRSSDIGLNGPVLGYALAVSLIASLVFGAVPALRAARRDPAAALGIARDSGPSRAQRRASDLLVIAEACLSLVLVTGAGLMIKGFSRLTSVEPGFESADVLTLRLVIPSGRYDSAPLREAYFTEIFERVGALPGVAGVGATNLLPLGEGELRLPYRVEGRALPAGEPSLAAFVRIGTPEYFDLLGIRFIEGRNLDPLLDKPQIPGDSAFVWPIVVNEKWVRTRWPEGSPIGARILAPPFVDVAEVVGVVADIRQVTLAQPPEPEFFFLASQSDWSVSYLLVKAARGDPFAIRSAVTSAVRRIDPMVGVRDARALRDVIDDSVGDPRLYMSLFTVLAGLALALALVGVYGVIHHVVSRRTREIGVRVALGASTASVLGTTMGFAMRPVAVGIGVGMLAAVFTTRLLSSSMYGVSTLDPVVFTSVALLVGASATAASLVPAVRATRLDPVQALREP